MNLLRPRIIPTLLMEHGRLVKTHKYENPKYVGDPVNAVKIFNEKQVDELLMYDIKAWQNNDPNYKLLEKIAAEARMPLCYGGGVNSPEQAQRIINLGFEKISISRAFFLQPDVIIKIANRIGVQSTVLTIDLRRRQATEDGWDIYVENGNKLISEDFAGVLSRLIYYNLGEIVVNSIDREGCCCGYDLKIINYVLGLVTIPATFQGGAGSVADLEEVLNKHKTIGLAAGTMFTFKGPHRAVLLNYARPSKLD